MEDFDIYSILERLEESKFCILDPDNGPIYVNDLQYYFTGVDDSRISNYYVIKVSDRDANGGWRTLSYLDSSEIKFMLKIKE